MRNLKAKIQNQILISRVNYLQQVLKNLYPPGMIKNLNEYLRINPDIKEGIPGMIIAPAILVHSRVGEAANTAVPMHQKATNQQT